MLIDKTLLDSLSAAAAASPRLRMNYDLRTSPEAGSPCFMMSVDLGRWHRLESLAHGTVIFECKDGAYEPLAPEDILEVA